MEKVYYYSSFDQNMVENPGQDKTLPEDYRYIRTGVLYSILSAIAYGVLVIVSWIYVRLVLKVRIVGRERLRHYHGSGYYVYGNHTQEQGDAFLPLIVSGFKHAYVVASPSNMGIPVLGRMLPVLGIIPTPSTTSQTRSFISAVHQRVAQGHSVFIYPEAHVWPYYTRIRPFPDTSFKFPSEDGKPVFSLTMTYQGRKKLAAYIDGPFTAEPLKSVKDNQKILHDNVFEAMTSRSKSSVYEHIKYIPK